MQWLILLLLSLLYGLKLGWWSVGYEMHKGLLLRRERSSTGEGVELGQWRWFGCGVCCVNCNHVWLGLMRRRLCGLRNYALWRGLCMRTEILIRLFYGLCRIVPRIEHEH